MMWHLEKPYADTDVDELKEAINFNSKIKALAWQQNKGALGRTEQKHSGAAKNLETTMS